MFPWADRPVAVDLHGTAFAAAKTDLVLEAVATLSPDLADHLFRECWARATHPDLGRRFSTWGPSDHVAKVEIAAQMVADRHNLRFILALQVDDVEIVGSDAPHGRPSDEAMRMKSA
jgi:hypothetical protein